MLPPNFTLLQVTPALDAGGVETLTLDVAAAAVRAGAGSLVASNGGGMEAVLAGRGAELIRMPMASRNPVTVIANARRLERVMRERRVSLAHVRSRAPMFSALIAARRAGVPIVATYHGIYSARSPLKRWYNAVMTRGDLVIANSCFTRDHILAEHQIAPERIAIIPEGIDTAVFDPAGVSAGRITAVRARWGLGDGDQRTVILVAARLTAWKGHRLLLEALARARGRQDAVLILAGGGEETTYADSLRSAAASLGLAEHVRLVGPCADMPAAYSLATIVASPSVLPESFGRGIAEAGAMRCPVMASRLGGAAETVLDGVTGWLVPPGDAEAWAAALDRALASSDDSRGAMGKRARERVERLFSLETMCEATFDLYRRLVRA